MAEENITKEQSMDNLLNDLIKVFELDDVILRYTFLLDGLDKIKDYDKIPYIQNYLKTMDNKEELYYNNVVKISKQIISKIEKDYVHEEIIDEYYINGVINWIIENITYETGIKTMYDFIMEGRGQCYYISRLFRDLLAENGIKSEIVKGYVIGREKEGLHAWNKVTVDKKDRFFDITFALTHDKGRPVWTWLEETEIIKTHIPIYTLKLKKFR